MTSENEEVTLKFEVKCDQFLPPSALMAITGNIEELGEWNPQFCLPMSCIKKNDKGEVWYRELKTRACKVEFRYIMVEMDETKSQSHVKILKWESRLKPRCFQAQETLAQKQPEVHVFGKYDDETKLQRGWLTGQTEVHLRVYGEAFKWFKPRHRERRAYLRVHQLRVVEEKGSESLNIISNPDEEETTDSMNLPPVIMATVSRLGTDTEPCLPDLNHFQGAICHTENDYHTFRLQTHNLSNMCIEVEVLVGSRLDSSEENEPRLVGTARLAPIERLQGVKWLHVFGNNRRVIGQVKIDFLVILPLCGITQFMDVSYANYWRFIRTLTIGHRGSGSDRDHTETETPLKENTLNSLRSAFDHGADYVEFDVHLSKDKVPVVYHDYSVALTLRKKKKGDLRYVKVAVKDLTLEELQNLKVSHTAVLQSEPCPDMMAAEQSDHLDSLVFVTLAQLFDYFDHDDNKIGFNIEVKYPLPLSNGDHELENYFERNEFLDIILTEILRKAGRRRILLSSFDPDICTMISLKQSRYPVVFLSQGITDLYPAYLDIRTQSHTMAIHHAVDSGILGINLFAEELLKNTDPILSLARSKKLVVILWGEELNKTSIQQQLKALKLDGLVFDRIHEHHQKGHLNVFRSTLTGKWSDVQLTSTANGSETETSILSDSDQCGPESKQAKVAFL